MGQANSGGNDAVHEAALVAWAWRKYGVELGEDVVVTGTALGLPDSAWQVFAKDNVDVLLRGDATLLECMPADDRCKVLEKRPFVKDAAAWRHIMHDAQVMRLAGRLGQFSLHEYGLFSCRTRSRRLRLRSWSWPRLWENCRQCRRGRGRERTPQPLQLNTSAKPLLWNQTRMLLTLLPLLAACRPCRHLHLNSLQLHPSRRQ